MTVFLDQTQINCQLNHFWKNLVSKSFTIFILSRNYTSNERAMYTAQKKLKWHFENLSDLSRKKIMLDIHTVMDCVMCRNTLTKKSLQQLKMVLRSLIVPHMLVFMPDNIPHAPNETKEGVVGDLTCQISIRISLKSWTVWGARCSWGVCGDDRCPHTSNSQCYGSGITSRT